MLKEDSNKKYIQSSASFSIITIGSRLLGLARETLKAFCFGTSIMAVAFDIAFRIPNILRNLVAEGALSHAFVPIYEKYKKTSEEKNFIGSILTFFVIFLAILCILAILFLPHVLKILVGDQKVYELALDLSYILFPFIFFIGISSIFLGILQSNRIFWITAFTPLLMNIVTILLFGLWMILFHKQNAYVELSIYIFSGTILLSVVITLVFHIYFLKKYYQLFPLLKIRFSYIQQLLVIMLPSILGSSVIEIGKLIDIILATRIIEVPGALAALTYAHRLIHLPMGVIGIAISVVALSSLSTYAFQKRWDKFTDSISFGCILNIYFILPATFGLIIFAPEIVTVLFGYGQFDKESVRITSVALRYYSTGLLAFCLQKLFIVAWYSQKNAKIPVLITILVLVLNTTISILLIPYLQHSGIALGSSIAAYFGMIVYIILLYLKKIFFITPNFLKELAKILFINAIFFVFIIQVKKIADNFWGSSNAYFTLLFSFGSAIFVYIILSHIIKITAYQEIISLFYKKKS